VTSTRPRALLEGKTLAEIGSVHAVPLNTAVGADGTVEGSGGATGLGAKRTDLVEDGQRDASALLPGLLGKSETAVSLHGVELLGPDPLGLGVNTIGSGLLNDNGLRPVKTIGRALP